MDILRYLRYLSPGNEVAPRFLKNCYYDINKRERGWLRFEVYGMITKKELQIPKYLKGDVKTSH